MPAPLLDLRYNENVSRDQRLKNILRRAILVIFQLKFYHKIKPIRDPGIVGDHACDRDATKLRSQLEPWGTLCSGDASLNPLASQLTQRNIEEGM